jgi:hypothetical protein
MATAAQVVTDYESLGPEEKVFVQNALPTPPGKGLTLVWVLVLVGLFVGALLAGIASYNFYVAGNKDAAAVFLAITTTVLGAFIGLIAPSPVKTG